MKLISTDYCNTTDKELVELFIHSKKYKKYILGINKFTKQVQKYVQIDGIIDDFTRVQSSRKKTVLNIDSVPKDALILSTSSGSPLSVAHGLNQRGFQHVNYLAFYKYSQLDLKAPDFMSDFEEDFSANKEAYEETYALLSDTKSKEVFEKVINFKISFDLNFMEGFTNNHEEQYFDKELIPTIKKIRFVDAGAYVGDTLPQIIKNFPDFEKIYCIEPNDLHLSIAKRDFGENKKIVFIPCGLGKEKVIYSNNPIVQNNCDHNYQAENMNSIDNLIKNRVDYIKMDIEGAEQNALLGAEKTIRKYHPILAICIYHQAQDWYKVPQIVLNIREDYNIYLRHYMEGIYETVMYFIPKKSEMNLCPIF